MRRFHCLLSLITLSWMTFPGCGESPKKPITPDEERQMEQDLQKARQAEGAAAKGGR